MSNGKDATFSDSLNVPILEKSLKVPDHQVAGHSILDGKTGPLIDDSGHFYKPLPDDGRGSKELAFYASLASNTKIPDHIRKFFPIYYTTQIVKSCDGSVRPYLMMQDIVYDRANPSVIDIKIGARTWYPHASDKYIAKCLKRDRERTSSSLGFRVSGLQVYGDKDFGFWKPDRKIVDDYNVDDVRLVLRKFVSSNMTLNSPPDCCFATSIYGKILAQLLELKAWFEYQTVYHFSSCSVLMVYEKESILKGRSSKADVKLVDLAHYVEGEGVIDHNFLGGLCSLIKFISEILTRQEKN